MAHDFIDEASVQMGAVTLIMTSYVGIDENGVRRVIVDLCVSCIFSSTFLIVLQAPEALSRRVHPVVA